MPERKVFEVRSQRPARDRRTTRAEDGAPPVVAETGFTCPVCYLGTPCPDHPWRRSRRDRNRRAD